MKWNFKRSCRIEMGFLLACIGILVAGRGLAAFEEVSLADQGIEFSVNQDGLQSIAGEIKSRVMTPIRQMPLPDINTSVDYGIRVKASGLHFSLDFTSLNLNPENNSLGVTVGVRNILINVPRIKASKKVIWDISTTCKNTRIKIAYQNELLISPTVPVWLEGDRIKLRLNEIRFDIPDQEFQVVGPSECSGALGIGSLIRPIMSRVLGNSKNMIRDAIIGQIKQLGPMLEQELNQLAHQSVNLKSQPVPVLPAVEGYLHLKPYQLNLTPEALKLVFSVQFSDSLWNSPLKSPEKNWFINRRLLGTVGINPQLIQEAFALWIVGTGGTIPLNDLEPARAFTDPALAKIIWPDLGRFPGMHQPLRLNLSFGESPVLTVDPETQDIILRSDKLLLNILTHSIDGYRLLYQIRLAVTLRAQLILDGDLLYLRVTERPVPMFEGRWADTWNPENPAVDLDLLSRNVQQLTDFLWQEGEPLYYMFVPTIFTGSQYIQLDQLRYQEPFLNVSVFQTQSP